MSAQSQALALPEVLEAILLELPIRDLLTSAPLVSKSWNEAITSSAAIQQALFFQQRRESRGQDPEINPLLQWAFPPWFPPKSSQHDTRGLRFTRLDWNKSAKKTAAYSARCASWRKMLPTQPPPTHLLIEQKSHYQVGSFVSEGEVDFPEGVRMGTLYDYAYKTVARPISSLVIEWDLGENREGDAKQRG